MRAAIVHHYGQTPVLGGIPTPRPGSRQVLISLRTAALNPIDGRLSRGDWRIMLPGAMDLDMAAALQTIGMTGLALTTWSNHSAAGLS
ncbi:hypothetical protein ACFYXF_51530 [Streptomyces sp. NPDC002680]|uniref:hypothetical protein n=1 Tax=Streptomyces sp. NPDC002680 TaxID=3364659 RepID=UPI0036A0F051